MHVNDQELLRLARTGRHAAAETLWSRHAASVRAYAASVLGVRAASDAADDAAQAVFCRMLTADAHEAIRDVRAWLISAVRRESLNVLRSARRRQRLHGAVQGRVGSLPVPNDTDDVEAAVAALPRRQREVIVLRHVAGLTFDAISVATGLPRSTVVSRYNSAIRILRGLLERGNAPTAPAPDEVMGVTHA